VEQTGNTAKGAHPIKAKDQETRGHRQSRPKNGPQAESPHPQVGHEGGHPRQGEQGQQGKWSTTPFGLITTMSHNAEFMSGQGSRNAPQRVIIMGPPGSGKSTIGQALADSMGVPLISTGQLLRDEAAKGTPLGARAKSLTDQGMYASDDDVNEALRHRLAVPDAAGGFVLDGYPRTKAQAQGITNMSTIDKVLYLDLPSSESEKRLLNRGKTSGRSDDTADVITNRLALYDRETLPIRDHFQKQGLEQTIDAMNPWRDLK